MAPPAVPSGSASQKCGKKGADPDKDSDSSDEEHGGEKSKTPPKDKGNNIGILLMNHLILTHFSGSDSDTSLNSGSSTTVTPERAQGVKRKRKLIPKIVLKKRPVSRGACKDPSEDDLDCSDDEDDDDKSVGSVVSKVGNLGATEKVSTWK